MANYNSNPERYINPNTVNTTKFVKIFSTDPRNNPEFLAANPFAVVIDNNYAGEEYFDFEDITVALDPKEPEIPPPPPPDDKAETLSAASDLSIKNFTLNIGSDGNATYSAIITYTPGSNAKKHTALWKVVE